MKRLATTVVFLGFFLLSVVKAHAAYTCGGGEIDFQDPAGSYTIPMVAMPPGLWTNVGLTISDSSSGYTYWDMAHGNDRVHCIGRWNGTSFKIQCPQQGSGLIPHEIEFEGTQVNNGTSATLTAQGYTDIFGTLHTQYTSFTATSNSLMKNRGLVGAPIPCPNATVTTVHNKTYAWVINGVYYSGVVTTVAQAHSYYEMSFSNPSATLFPNWNGFAFAVLDSNGIMNVYLQTGVDGSHGSGPWGQGTATDPIWMWKQWSPPYAYYQYDVGPYVVATGSDFDITGDAP